MDYVTSRDGTEIAFERSGDGPALILVHGTGGSRHVWERVRPELNEYFTVYAVDRRGRGESGDADDYSIEREFEDLAAVADSIDGPVNLLGHSYGAVCAIGAAPRIANLRRLVLYEPALSRGEELRPGEEEVIEQMEEYVEEGENEKVLESFYRDITGDVSRLERLRSRPGFDRRVASAPTLPRELLGRNEFQPTPETYPDLSVPTLLLVGTDTAEPLKQSAETAVALFPNSRLVNLEGQGHGAMNSAPEDFAREVVDFLVD